MIISIRVPAITDNCTKWFKESGISQDVNCLMSCVIYPIDMGTFICHDQCEDLCTVSFKEKILFKLTDLYPGLTAEEKAIVTQYPIKSLEAYKLSWKAEKICLSIYPSLETNDESDACRHFIWACLLVKDFGKGFAEKILDAHEQEPSQSENEKAMDLANNRRGTSVAFDLLKNKSFSEERIKGIFLDELKKGRLIIIKKRIKK